MKSRTIFTELVASAARRGEWQRYAARRGEWQRRPRGEVSGSGTVAAFRVSRSACSQSKKRAKHAKDVSETQLPELPTELSLTLITVN